MKLPAEPATTASDSGNATDSVEIVNGRYRTIRSLGKGGMGAVYLAIDTAEGDRPVALKRVRKDRIDRRALAILRNEFLVLSSLSHPNLTRAYDFGSDHETGDLFFTSEYVNGINWMRAAQRLDLSQRKGFETFLELMAQVLRALEFIHSRGMVHSDIKPENILVTAGGGAEGRDKNGLHIKLIDFGLAKREEDSGGKKVLGTPYYVAPETILGSSIDRRTDLYSLGVVLYHLTTGRPPFRGETNIEILKSHVDLSPVPPHELAPAVSRQLGEIILRLMEKKPQDRFQSALEVIDRTNRVFGLSIPFETPETCISYLEAARLAGRKEEVARLRAVFLAASATRAFGHDPDEEPDAVRRDEAPGLGEAGTRAEVPRGRMVLVRGEKGLQKRRLIDELRSTAQAHGARFLQVECAGSGGGPGQGFERLVGELAAFDELRGRDRSLRYVENAVRLVQKLQNLKDEPISGYEPVLDEMVLALLKASQQTPIVLHFHDIHLAGRPVLRLVESLIRAASETSVPGCRFLLTATVPDRAELGENDFQRLTTATEHRSSVLELELKRLGEEEVGDLVRGALAGGEFPEAFVHRVLEESDGNTEVVLEILKHFLDREKITRTPLGWVLGSDYENEDLPGRVRHELKERLSKLPEDALSLATAFACMGDACDLDLAVNLSGIPARSVFKSLEVLRREKILQAGGPENRPGVYSFVHSSARAILYNCIPAEDIAALHDRAGTLCESRGGPQEKDQARILAHHFFKSGNREKGIRYGLEAARDLARELAPLQAIETYEKVLALAGPDDRALGFKIHREVASLRFQVGDYRGVIDLLDPSRVPPETRMPDKVSVYLEAARAHVRLGQFEQATLFLNRSIRGGEGQESAPELAAIMLALAELHHYKGNLVESLRCCTRLMKSRCELKESKLLAELHMLLAENHSTLNNMETAVSHCQLALRIIEAQHDAQHLAWSLFCRGKYHLYKRQLSKALRQFQLCLLLRRKTSEFDGQADCLMEIGMLHHLMGSQGEARSHLEQALSLYTKSGNLSRSVAVLCALAEVLRLLGEYDASEETVEEALGRMAPLEQRRLTLQTLLTMAGIALDKGDLASAKRHLEEADRAALPGRGASAGMLGMFPLLSDLALHGGELGAALERAGEGVLAAREVKDPVALARITVQQAYLLCRLGKTGEARRNLVTLFEAARSHDLPALNGWARMIEGMALIDEDKLDNAEKSFSEAAEILTAHGSARDLAHLYLEYGLLCLRLGHHEQAYLNFEEGLYLAEKLQLSYLRCRYSFAVAALEAAIPDGQASRAERNLLFAETMSSQAPYPEIQWQVRSHLGKLFLANRRFAEAEARFKQALAGLNAILRKMPAANVQSYRKASGAKDIETMVEGCRFVALPSLGLK